MSCCAEHCRVLRWAFNQRQYLSALDIGTVKAAVSRGLSVAMRHLSRLATATGLVYSLITDHPNTDIGRRSFGTEIRLEDTERVRHLRGELATFLLAPFGASLPSSDSQTTLLTYGNSCAHNL